MKISNVILFSTLYRKSTSGIECNDEKQKLGKYLCFLETNHHTRQKGNYSPNNLTSHKEKDSGWKGPYCFVKIQSMPVLKRTNQCWSIDALQRTRVLVPVVTWQLPVTSVLRDLTPLFVFQELLIECGAYIYPSRVTHKCMNKT